MKLNFRLFICILSIFILASFGKINQSYGETKLDINTASMGDIAKNLNPIAGKDLCHVITQHRQEKGQFESIEALKEIKEIDEKTFALIKEHVVAVVIKK